MILPILLLLTTHIQSNAPGVAYKQPQLAAGYGQVALTFGAGTAIYYAASPDGGHSFAAPVKVSDVEALALGRHRGPRIALLKDAIVISAVAGGPQHGDLVVWRSTDHGKSWQRGAVVNDVPGSAREGLHTMTADGRGRLFAAWLDLRKKGTRLYGATSDDSGATWSKNMLVYESPEGTICQCCHPSSSFDEKGQIWTMWRNALGGSRDFYAASSPDGAHFEAAHKLGSGTWKLDACPMDGGGFTVDQGEVISAWRRDDVVFLAHAGKSEQPIGKGKDVALASSTRGPVVAWTKGEGIEVLTPDSDKPTELSQHGAFVNLLALPGGTVLAAWEADGEIQVTQVTRSRR